MLLRSSLGRRRGEERAPRWSTTQPSHVRGRSANTSRGEKRVARAPQYPNAMSTHLHTSCRQPVAMLVRLSPDGRRGEERAPRWPTIQPCQVCTAARASWVVGRYSTGQKARGPRTTGFERGRNDLTKPVPSTCRGVGAVEHRPTALGGACPALVHHTTADLPRCWCGRASADGVGRSARRVGLQRNYTKSALHGACAA